MRRIVCFKKTRDSLLDIMEVTVAVTGTAIPVLREREVCEWGQIEQNKERKMVRK